MNMFKKAKVKTVKGYIDALPKERKEMVDFLHKFIQKTVPKFKPYFSEYGIGYDKFPYKNYKKEMIEWPVIGLVSQKHYISIYVCAVHEGKYIAERYKKELGKVSVGRSCIRIKKLENVNLPALGKVLKEHEESAETFEEWMNKLKPHYAEAHADFMKQKGGQSKEEQMAGMQKMDD